MIGNLRNRMKTKKNNRGAAMIMVIVSIAFIGMLVAMIVYMAYCNYLMKGTDRNAKNNFYSAEKALDVINAGLQQDVSDSMAEAYVYAMKFSEGLTEDLMSNKFQEQYFKQLEARIDEKEYPAGGGAPTEKNKNKWDIQHLKNILTAGGIAPSDSIGVPNTVYIGCVDGTSNTLVHNAGSSYTTMENLKIVYTNDNGYVSIIETDIRIKEPDLNYAVATNRLNVENYSLIANDRLINSTNYENAPTGLGLGANTTVTGNVFGGNDGIYVENQKSLSFISPPAAPAADPSAPPVHYNLVANTFNVSNAKTGVGFATDDKHWSYTSNINVTTGNLSLDGITYVSDDLTTDGSGNNIKLSGIYRGYGDSLNNSGASSSILVNGARTSLDFSNLKELFLVGHAYVGTRHYDADAARYESVYGNSADGDYIKDVQDYDKKLASVSGNTVSANSVEKNTKDIMLGESVSVKANQLIYMVPADCVGFDTETGAQVVAKNPMSYDEYKMLTSTYKKDPNDNSKYTTELKYKVVDLSKLWTRLGTSYTSGYKAVFRRVNGSVLVYLYLDFGTNEIQANDFFEAYYNYDKDGLARYIKSYISDISWNPSMAGNNNQYLTLAGNSFYFNSKGELILQKSTLNDSDSKMEAALNNADDYADTFTALMHVLKDNIAETTSMEQGKTVFENVVDSAAIDKITTKDFKADPTNLTDPILAHVDTGDFVYESIGSDGSPSKYASLKLIIAKGNVYLQDNFDGLVIAGGDIVIGSRCNTVTYNPTEVLKALRAKCDSGYFAYEALGDSGKLTYAETTEVAGNEYVDLGSLIVYQNWKKE